jgi:hypothetical protein
MRVLPSPVARLVPALVIAGLAPVWLAASPGSQVPVQRSVPKVPSLVPVVILSVGVDAVAHPLSSPTGAPLPGGELFLPRGSGKTLVFLTSSGHDEVSFSVAPPPGVPAGTFSWEQTKVQGPSAAGRLDYHGCAGCPASFTLTVRASTGPKSATASVRIALISSTGRPAISSFVPANDNGLPLGLHRFSVQFAAGTFNADDSEAIGVYGNLKYRLVLDRASPPTSSSMTLLIPRLQLDRTVRVFFRNPLGVSTTFTIGLPAQAQEVSFPFECVNCSTFSTVVGGTILAKSLFDTVTDSFPQAAPVPTHAEDRIVLPPLEAGTTPCDRPDFIYLGASVSVLDPKNPNPPAKGPGTVRITSQPPLNTLLRAPQNVITVDFEKPALVGEWFWQVAFKGAGVIGTCSDRVVTQ